MSAKEGRRGEREDGSQRAERCFRGSRWGNRYTSKAIFTAGMDMHSSMPRSRSFANGISAQPARLLGIYEVKRGITPSEISGPTGVNRSLTRRLQIVIPHDAAGADNGPGG